MSEAEAPNTASGFTITISPTILGLGLPFEGGLSWGSGDVIVNGELQRHSYVAGLFGGTVLGLSPIDISFDYIIFSPGHDVTSLRGVGAVFAHASGPQAGLIVNDSGEVIGVLSGLRTNLAENNADISIGFTYLQPSVNASQSFWELEGLPPTDEFVANSVGISEDGLNLAFDVLDTSSNIVTTWELSRTDIEKAPSLISRQTHLPSIDLFLNTNFPFNDVTNAFDIGATSLDFGDFGYDIGIVAPGLALSVTTPVVSPVPADALPSGFSAFEAGADQATWLSFVDRETGAVARQIGIGADPAADPADLFAATVLLDRTYGADANGAPGFSDAFIAGGVTVATGSSPVAGVYVVNDAAAADAEDPDVITGGDGDETSEGGSGDDTLGAPNRLGGPRVIVQPGSAGDGSQPTVYSSFEHEVVVSARSIGNILGTTLGRDLAVAMDAAANENSGALHANLHAVA